ncbi:MAG: secretin N-terminal domain-containing protein [Candidatus Omnitrophota bacterium]|nr:secretin N-terminal domain-containing protein [Candidatus Omnitrophota bacterium]
MRKYIIGMLFILALSSIAFGAQEDASDLISLDLKGMDIRDVLKILSQKSGLNIVADSDVKGPVTVYIKDVSVMSALDIITSINNLAYEQDGTLIRVMREIEYEKNYGSKFRDKTRTEVIKLNYANASEVAKVAAEMRATKGKVIADEASNTIVLVDIPENIMKMKAVILAMDAPLVTEVFSLDYAKAELIKDKLEQMLSKGIGSLKFDERTNNLVIKDTPQRIADIKKVIEAFDEKTREVVIDANIIQVTLSDKNSLGIDWNAVAKTGDFKLEGVTNFSASVANVTTNKLTISTGGGGDHHAILNLLKTYGRTDVLSRPRITVADRQEAKILVGSKEVYVTSNITTTVGGTYNTADNIQFVDVGVRLAVTPQINKQGFITLKIKPEVSSADATKTVILKNPDGSTRTVVPYVTTSEAETTVLVKDNTTIIIGGLMKDSLVNNIQKVPFLGDIPLMGKLFTTKGKTKEKTELVVFLTPHIIEGDSTSEEAKKYMTDWDKKQEEIIIEEPKDPEWKFPVAETYQKRYPEPKDLTRKASEAPKSKQRWANVMGNPPAAKTQERLYNADTRDSSSSVKTAYEEYYFGLRQEINSLAKNDKDVTGLAGDVEIQFTLDREGFIVSGPVVLNKPDLRLVRSAVRIVKKAMPFQRFPKELKQNQADFNITVKYE